LGFPLVDEIQGTDRGMTTACHPENCQHFHAWSLPQLADFLEFGGGTSEFEIFPQATSYSQEEKTDFDC
jgi:hypothetical protein